MQKTCTYSVRAQGVDPRKAAAQTAEHIPKAVLQVNQANGAAPTPTLA